MLTLKTAFAALMEEKWKYKSTWRTYKSHIAHFLEELGDVPLDRLTDSTMRKYVHRREASGESGASIARRLSTIRAVLQYGVDEKAITTTPRVANPTVIDSDRESIPPDVISNILAGMADVPAMALYTRALYETGLRPGEMRRIAARNLRNGSLTIVATKNGRRRTVPLSPALAESLESLFVDAGGRTCAWPFSDRQFSYRWARVAREVGHEYPVYSLRHSFGTELARAGTNPITIADLMGHRNLDTVRHYVHVSATETTAAVASLPTV